ncbi:sulfatase-like hydrolase/transferase [Thermococcus henrietii]|uniref:sulfatase-like hydrolase/transferase n=1 Tax=Thermococcus henrietii TaxID=2016361 RepID=UPI000C0890C2|nr:sulfatase-like hydrolase/transferase [Thermococcus henrietii]
MDCPNVMFIIVDTLRDDYAKSLKSELKKLGFIPYENVIATASWTTPSHASIFTGMYPAFHEAHETKDKKDVKVRLNIKRNLLSFKLRELGYDTYLLSANPYIRPEFGFVGFDNFYDSMYLPQFSLLSSTEKTLIKRLENHYKSKLKLIWGFVQNRYFNLLIKASLSYLVSKPYLYIYSALKRWPKDKGATDIIKVLKQYLSSAESIPKFVFINFMEVHEPYFLGDDLGGTGFRENLKTNTLKWEFVQKWTKLYPNEVLYITKKIIDIMKFLKEKRTFDDFLIIVTSDHGQLLGEHNRIGHGTFLYDELLRVPLLVKYPKCHELELLDPNNKLQQYVSLTKLKPFILGLIDNKFSDDSVLYNDTVFAESYGIHQNVGKPRNEIERKNIEELEKYRIAIYYKNFKGIFNVTDWKFEKIISYDPNIEVTEDIVKHMKKEVIKFLKMATATKVPKIKF